MSQILEQSMSGMLADFYPSIQHNQLTGVHQGATLVAFQKLSKKEDKVDFPALISEL